MSGTRRTVAVLFERFGPYHKARLESTGVYLKQNNWSVLGVELARDDNVYEWDAVEGADEC